MVSGRTPCAAGAGRRRGARGRARRPQAATWPDTASVPLLEAEVIDRRGVRTTGLQRTIADCLGRLPRVEAESLAAWVGSRDRLDELALERHIAERPRSWGNAQRRQALDDQRAGAFNAAERRLHTILRRAGIRGWRGNAPVIVGGRTIARADVLFEGARVVIEVDGFAYHDAQRFQGDRDRQNLIVAAGYLVLRFTWDDLMHRPATVRRAIEAVLDLRRPHA